MNANTLKTGAYLAASNIPGRRPDSIFRLVDSEHVKPGKGGAYVQCKLIDVRTKDLFLNRFNSSDKVEVIELDPSFKAQYLYEADGNPNPNPNPTPNPNLLRGGRWAAPPPPSPPPPPRPVCSRGPPGWG